MAPTATPIRSAELRTLAEGAADNLRELRTMHPDRRSDTWADDMRSATNELMALDREFDFATKAEAYDLQRMAFEIAASAPPASESRGPEAATRSGGREARTAGEVFTDRDEYRSFVESRSGRLPEMEMRALATTYSDDPGGNDIWLPIGTPTLKSPRQQRFFLRDLLDVAPTTLAAVPYIRELTPTSTETGAAMTAQGSAKAEVSNSFEQDTAIIQKVTAWIPVTEEVLMDAPLLAAYITNRLTYMLQVREQAQVLSGNGTAPQIKGILQFSGVQTQATVADDPWAVIGLAAGKIENVDGYADGIAMNPLDYWAGVVERHANQYDGTAQGSAPFGTPTPTVWGLPVVRTRALSSGDVIVGDWAAGATLLDRQQITVRQSDSHDDYFVKNKVAVLAEERIGLAVHRPDFFVDCTVTFT